MGAELQNGWCKDRPHWCPGTLHSHVHSGAHTRAQAPAILCTPHLTPSPSALQGVNPAVPCASLGNDILLNKQTGAVPVDL